MTADKTGGRSDAGWDLDGQDDVSFVEEGSLWVLWWKMNQDGSIAKRKKLEWQFYDGEVRSAAGKWKSGREKGYQPVALPAKPQPTAIPFLIDDAFSEIFAEVLLRDEYKDLRDKDYEDAWITPRLLKQNVSFWHDLKSEYRNRHGVNATK